MLPLPSKVFLMTNRNMKEVLTNTNTTENSENELSFLNMKEILKIVILYWPWIIVSVFFALCCAKAYLWYKDPIYSHNMTLLVKDDSKKPSYRGNSSLMNMENIGLIANTSGFDNELLILQSSSINSRVVKALHLYTTYYVRNRLKKREVYNDETPIIVDMPMSQLEELKNPISLKIKQENGLYNVKIAFVLPKAKKVTKKECVIKNMPATISTPMGKVMLQLSPNAQLGDSTFYANILPLEMATTMYSKRLSVEAASKTTTVAIIRMNDNNTDRALDYLHELFSAYNEDANEDKNEVAQKTEEFIRERIEHIRAELDNTEIDLEQYKRSNELIDASSAASLALNSTAEFQKQQAEIQTQLNLLDALAGYVDNPANFMQVIPANLGLSDKALNEEIKSYNEYVMQRKRLLKSSSEDNPMVQRATSYIEELWPSIKLSINAIRKNIAMQKESADKQFHRYNDRITSAPKQERELTNISRQQEIKATLYLMLLQRQEENFISLASTAAKARIIEEPQMMVKVSPKNMMIWLAALALGIAFPIGLFLLGRIMRLRIEGHEDVEGLTQATILADIPLSQMAMANNQGVVVHENSNDLMEESFRGLRTNLRFVMQKDEKVLIVTSCIPGEGKTFISTNTAMSLALMGKKVVIVGLDIRKPRLVKLFNLPNEKKGITSFLTDDSTDFASLDHHIYHQVMNKNLDVLPAGIIPPNPSELISRERLDIAINLLREHYDYVVLDTPPVSLVSDTLAIGRVADATIFVCRADFSPRSNFGLINALYDDKKLPNINMVINGVDLARKKYGLYYGYGKYGKYSRYGYGKYGKYGHYSNYSHYGMYGKYGSEDSGKSHIEK